MLPELGESVTEGTITRWLKKVGDAVALDEPLLEISTDKVDTEIPSPFAGVLQEILVQEDETVAVGSALARIGEEGAAPAAAPAPAEAPAPALHRPRPPRRQPRLRHRAPLLPLPASGTGSSGSGACAARRRSTRSSGPGPGSRDPGSRRGRPCSHR